MKVAAVADLEAARDEVQSVMRKIRHLAPGDPDDFAINQQDQILAMVHRVTGGHRHRSACLSPAFPCSSAASAS